MYICIYIYVYIIDMCKYTYMTRRVLERYLSEQLHEREVSLGRVYLSIYLSFYLSIYLYICEYIYIYAYVYI